ncbi:MAG TPA: cytochrome c biogenesis protein CcsA [Methylomirabilota bacterium]|nr:cytochrome c biogenesis protein CcsA [Methylomirabilota bacterium]
MKTIHRILPWAFLALFATEILVILLPKRDKEFHVREFGRLPVLLNGRVQPFDSVARNSLLQIRSTASVPLEEKKFYEFWKHPPKLKASEWLLEVMFKPEQADTRPIFLIHHPELLAELGLENKGIEKSGLRYYTYREIEAVESNVMNRASQFSDIKADLQTPLQRQTLKLANAIVTYRRLKNSLRPEHADDFARDLAAFEQSIGPGVAALRAQQAGQPHDAAALDRLMEWARQYDLLSRSALPLIVPPLANSGDGSDAWSNAGASLLDSLRSEAIHPAMRAFATMASAYRHNQPEMFNRSIADYRAWLAEHFPKELKKGRWEFFYNDAQGFLHSTIIYIFAFVLAATGLLSTSLWPGFSEALRRSAFYLIILSFLVHTGALIFRMVLEGRPPVTNLYSSAIFIGWGAVIFGLSLERIYRAGIGNVVAAVAGFVTLLIAHNLALGGDTMQMLQAVLDTNFWLATHVVVVTLGYAATFVAGVLAIAYILLGVFTRLLQRPLTPAGAATLSATAATGSGLNLGKALSKMVYAVICFATLFSFVGTVLGGIWADQSWGRFWGWDPKENGALIIVLWNAIILHARWGGMARDRGIMNMAVFGNVVTAFSWFGVNLLSIGLHSYGFMDGGAFWLYGVFVPSQLFIIALGLIPLQYWRSFRAPTPEGPAPSSQPSTVPG